MNDAASSSPEPRSTDTDAPLAYWTRPIVVAGFVCVLMAIKLVMAGTTELIRDEAYYSLWALHPLRASYFDHPPAVAWFIKAGYALLGPSELAARLPAVLSVGLVSLAVFRTAMLVFGDRRIAAYSVYAFNLTPGAMLGLLVITPDAPSMLFWMLSIWSAAELLRSNDGRWWLVFGLSAGLGLAAKYTGLFLGAGVVLWLLFDRRNRHWFTSPWLYAGGAVALAIFAPVIAWNLNNSLSSFEFQFGRSARGLQWFDWTDTKHLPEFLAGQIALLLPGLFIMGAAAHWRFARHRSERGNRGFALLIWTGIPALVYFITFSLHSVTQGNWTWPLYAQWSIVGAWAIYAWKPDWAWLRTIQRWTRRAQVPVGALVAAVIFAQAQFQPVRLPFADQTLTMHGWTEVASNIETERRRAGIGTILARGYGLYGYLETYGRFAGHGYRVLPLDEFHRYGFVDLPASDDAVDWPVLVAVHVSGTEPPTGPPAAIANANPPAQWFTRIVRPAADGAPASAIDLYRLERPETPLFGSD